MKYLPRPRDANIYDACYSKNEDNTGNDDKGIRKHLPAESNGSLRTKGLFGWHHRCVDIDHLRMNSQRHLSSDILHGLLFQ